jgi:hypothetical protein
MELGKEKFVMLPGEYIRVQPLILHRFSGLINSIILESSTHHDDDDSYRNENSSLIVE